MLSRLVMIARSQLTGSKVALSALTKPNIRDRAIIRQICNIKTEDVATARPRELLVKLELKDLDLILRESKLRWFGYVERPWGTVRSACDIQVDGRRRTGRPKMTWTEIEWERLRAWKAVTWTGAHWCGWCVPASACLSKTQRWWWIMLNSVLGMIISKKVRVQRSGIKSSPIPYLL